MWYHIVPMIHREKFFFFSHSIAFLWFIPLDIFSDSLIWCSMRGFDYLSLSPLLGIQLFQVFRLQMLPEYLGHTNEEFLESLYLDVEMLVIGYYISVFLLLQQITTNLAALNNVKFIVGVLKIRVWNGNHCTKISVSAGPYFNRGSGGGSFCWPFPASGGCLYSLAPGFFLHRQCQQSSFFKSLSLPVPLLLQEHFLSDSLSGLPLQRAFVIIWAHPDNPQLPPIFRSLT